MKNNSKNKQEDKAKKLSEQLKKNIARRKQSAKAAKENDNDSKE
jgi:hypothetical protein